MTDNYQYNKCLEPQSINDSSPYADKQWLYLPDLNNGVYQQNNTLIQFNAQNIYNSQKFVGASDMFFVIPIQMVAGIYGMNFDVMPELRWKFGYPMVLTGLLIVTGFLYRKFKKAKWL